MIDIDNLKLTRINDYKRVCKDLNFEYDFSIEEILHSFTNMEELMEFDYVGKIFKIQESLEYNKKIKTKEISLSVSNIIKSKYGSIENQTNIFNGLGIYKTKDKSNYKTFTNNILKQEDRFKNQVNDIQTIEELNNFKYEFIWE